MTHGMQWPTLGNDTRRSAGSARSIRTHLHPSTMAAIQGAMTTPPIWAMTFDTLALSPPQRKRRPWLRYALLAVALCALIVAGRAIKRELLTSENQAHYLTSLARQLTFHVASGPSPSVRFPTTGPYNRRLGYIHLPDFLEKLMADTYMFEAQARLSPRLQQIIDTGIFPIYREKTYEDSSIVDPEERLKAFGQSDHIRKYGWDYVDRLREAGFTVDTIRVSDLVNGNQAVRMGLASAGAIFYCTK